MPLKDIAGDYIRANFRPDDRLVIVLIQKRSGVVTTRVSTAEKIASPEYQAWLKHMNAQRYEIYISMNSLRPEARGRHKADIDQIRHVYLDFDTNGTEAVAAMRARADMPAPNHILTSSPGKFQVVSRVEGFGKDEAEQLMRGMTRALGADVAASDCARVFRLPGFYNHKYSSPHFVTVENLSGDVYLPSQFPDLPAEESLRRWTSNVAVPVPWSGGTRRPLVQASRNGIGRLRCGRWEGVRRPRMWCAPSRRIGGIRQIPASTPGTPSKGHNLFCGTPTSPIVRTRVFTIGE